MMANYGNKEDTNNPEDPRPTKRSRLTTPPKDKKLPDEVLSLSQPKMVARYGYTNAYLEDCREQLQFGFIPTSRAKLWGEVNTVHEEAELKSTGIADKSAAYGSAESGKVLSSHKLLEKYFADIDRKRKAAKGTEKEYQFPDGVYPLPDHMKDLNGNIQYVTFERQTLQTIEGRIATGYYKIIKAGIHEDTGVEFRIIADQRGGLFKIDYDPASFVDIKFSTGSPVSVKERKFFIESRSTQSFKSLEWLIDRNLKSSVILRRLDRGVPYILCSATGRPIKGDVDLQDAFVPNDLPLMAYACIDNEKIHNVSDLIMLMESYKKELNAFREENSPSSVKYLYIEKNIDRAIANLKKISVDRNAIASLNLSEKSDVSANADEIIIKEIGVLKLSDAVFLFAKQNGVLHGSDAFSPVKPENFAVTHILDPDKPGRTLITHGEFEYLKILLNNPKICDGKLKDFNLCHLIVDETLDWRKNLKDGICPEDNIMHEYLNKKDEQYCVKMHRLLMERQLLQCKLDFTPEKYSQHVTIMFENYAIMIDRIKLEGQDKVALEAAMREGLKVAEAIIANIAKFERPEDVKARLQEIRKITAPDQYLSIKKKLADISLDYYASGPAPTPSNGNSLT